MEARRPPPRFSAAMAAGKEKSQRQKLTMARWGLAIDRWILAAAVTDQLDYASGLAHKDNCLKISMQAQQKKRRFWLAIVYDDLCRKEWAERAYGNDPEFNINIEAGRTNEGLLMEAEAEYDSIVNAGKEGANGSAARSWNSHHQFGRNNNDWKKRKSDYGYGSQSGNDSGMSRLICRPWHSLHVFF